MKRGGYWGAGSRQKDFAVAEDNGQVINCHCRRHLARVDVLAADSKTIFGQLTLISCRVESGDWKLENGEW